MSDKEKITVLDECRLAWKHKVTGEPAVSTPLTKDLKVKGEKKIHPEPGGHADL